MVALYQADVTDRDAEDLLDRDASEFTRELVDAVEPRPARARRSDRAARHRTGRSTASPRWSGTSCAWRSRRSSTAPDVPAEVAIDEAVEAAKALCSAEAPGFVNGILAAVHRESVASA